MPRAQRNPAEKEYEMQTVLAQYRAGQKVILHNVRLLRIFKPAVTADGKPDINAPAFPPGDYGWYENPRAGDPCFSTLAPLSTREYWEKLQKTVHNISAASVWTFEIEEYPCNMEMTECEAAFFEEDDFGKVTVLRALYDPLYWWDDKKKENVILRAGINDVVLEASGDRELMDLDSIGEDLVKVGLHKGKPWKEVPEAYLRKARIPGGLGMVNDYMEINAVKELTRREKMGLIEAPKPTISEADQCEAITVSGSRCAKRGTIKVGDNLYCQQHSLKVGVGV
jgi:hypothetical protein